MKYVLISFLFVFIFSKKGCGQIVASDSSEFAKIINKDDLTLKWDSSDIKWNAFLVKWRKKYGWMDSIHAMNPHIELCVNHSDYYKETWANVDSLYRYDSLENCAITCHYNYVYLRHYHAMTRFYLNEVRYYWVLTYGLEDLQQIESDPQNKKQINSRCNCQP